jgi:hypothetical protein
LQQTEPGALIALVEQLKTELDTARLETNELKERVRFADREIERLEAIVEQYQIQLAAFTDTKNRREMNS